MVESPPLLDPHSEAKMVTLTLLCSRESCEVVAIVTTVN